MPSRAQEKPRALSSVDATYARTAVSLPPCLRNATAERFVRTIRAECLDWLLIVNRRHLERVLRVFVGHYNSHRPHRSLHQQPPLGEPPREPEAVIALDPMSGGETCSEASSTNTRPPRDHTRIEFPAPTGFGKVPEIGDFR